MDTTTCDQPMHSRSVNTSPFRHSLASSDLSFISHAERVMVLLSGGEWCLHHEIHDWCWISPGTPPPNQPLRSDSGHRFHSTWRCFSETQRQSLLKNSWQWATENNKHLPRPWPRTSKKTAIESNSNVMLRGQPGLLNVTSTQNLFYRSYSFNLRNNAINSFPQLWTL